MENYYQKEIETASPEQIRQWQSERLVKTVKHVWDNVPFYRGRMEEAGSPKAANIVLMARVAKYFDIPYEKWIAAIEKIVAPKFVELNRKAFELGYNA